MWLNAVFTALCDPLRRELIDLLVESPGMTVNDVCELFPVSRFTIMRHLNILESAELLNRQRDGTAKRLYINHSKLDSLTSGWLKAISDKAKQQKGKD